MTDRSAVQADCARIVALFSHELDLSSTQEAAYAQAVVAYVPTHYNDSQLQRLVRCYHLDHQEVQALRDARHPAYQDAWAKWPPQILRILRDANFAWLADSAVDIEDLVQIALKELHGSISSYRFSSRFSTWAYTVIVRAAQRTIREQRAAKRSGTQISLDDPEMINHLGTHTDDPVVVAQATALNADILRILTEQGGPRWAEIFQRWARADQRLVDIGQQIGLSPARVSTLLNQMRHLLRQHADIVEWYRPAENLSDTQNRGEE
jgi:RNA polymerase sigma factor (sigma-70 family)